MNKRSIASIVPIKLVVATVPVLPTIDQFPSAPLDQERACQLAKPVASETSTLPLPGLHHRILISPLISTFAAAFGDVVPKPTLQAEP